MSACQNRKQQGSGTSSSETIASLSRVCNFSSNIINDTLKSIFVKTSEYAHLFAQEWCQLNGRVYRWREGKRMEKLFPDVLHSLSTALTANSNWGSAKFNMKKNINLLTMFPPNMFWLYWNWISIFVSSHSTRQYICPIASGSVQTWNRVSKFLRFCLCRFFSLFFPSFYRINFRLTLQWIHIYDDYFNNIQFIHSEFAFNAHFTQGQRGETSEGEAELTMESMTIAMRAGGCWQVYRLWFQIPFCSWTNFNKRRKCLIKLVSSSVNSKLINSCRASM